MSVQCVNCGYVIENERNEREAYCRRCMAAGLPPVTEKERRSYRNHFIALLIVVVLGVVFLLRLW